MPNILFIVPFKLEIIPHDNTTKTRILCAKILTIKRETLYKIGFTVAVITAEISAQISAKICRQNYFDLLYLRDQKLAALNTDENHNLFRTWGETFPLTQKEGFTKLITCELQTRSTIEQIHTIEQLIRMDISADT